MGTVVPEEINSLLQYPSSNRKGLRTWQTCSELPLLGHTLLLTALKTSPYVNISVSFLNPCKLTEYAGRNPPV